MKKLLALVFILLIGVGMVFSQSITVTSPHAGDTWYKGDTKTIAWTKTGSMGNFVKIKLRNSTSTAVVLDIISHIPNNGNYSWEIPTSVASGNYVIRVRTMDNAVYGDSTVFTIAAELTFRPPSVIGIPARPHPIAKAIPKEPSLSVISPRSGDIWKKGEKGKIEWKSVNISGKIHLALHRSSGRRPGRFVGFIAKSIPVFPNSYKWEVGKFTDGRECESGEYYFVWIATQDGSVTDYSNSSVQIIGINLVCEIKDPKCYDKKKRKKIFVLDTEGEYGSYLKFKIYAKNNGVWPATSLNIKWRWRAYRRTYNSDHIYKFSGS